MNLFKECLRMEAICRTLAQQDSRNSEEWRAKARAWHQRAGRYVTEMFGEVEIPDLNEAPNMVTSAMSRDGVGYQRALRKSRQQSLQRRASLGCQNWHARSPGRMRTSKC